MKKNWNNGKSISLWVLVLSLLAFACQNKSTGHGGLHSEEKAVYTCPMHPEIMRDGPGSCPICGMDLVKEESDQATIALGSDSMGILLKPTNEYVLSATKTIRPIRKSMSDSLEVPGYLTYDERQLKAVSARYGGRIERLYVRYPFQPVKKGQRLLDIYSPDMATAQQDLIFLKENDADNATLLENARRRLSLLGMTDKQIQEVESKRKPHLSLSVFSPYAGLLVESPAPSPATTMPGSGMNGEKTGQSPTTPPAAANAEFSLKEGMYVQPGQRLFGLQSLATVWAILEFSPSNVQSLKIGQPVELHIESFAKTFRGKISHIEPLYGSGSKNLRVRVYLPNPGERLKPGTLLTATVQVSPDGSRGSSLWIPASAAIDLGQSKVVFVKTLGGFQSRRISTSQRSGFMVEVVSGLSLEDEIAENGQLLMDSEGFIKATNEQ